MLRKINSANDIRQLVIGDTLIDDVEISNARKYTVTNIHDGIIYAIYENGYSDLKVFSADLPPIRTGGFCRLNGLFYFHISALRLVPYLQ